jgi:hypothetical protein
MKVTKTWSERFDDEFGIKINDKETYFHLKTLEVKEVKAFISSLLQEIADKIEGSKIRHATNIKGEITEDDEDWQIELQKDIDAKNTAKDQDIAIIKKYIKGK